MIVSVYGDVVSVPRFVPFGPSNCHCTEEMVVFASDAVADAMIVPLTDAPATGAVMLMAGGLMTGGGGGGGGGTTAAVTTKETFADVP